jgi:hypothetical protein
MSAGVGAQLGTIDLPLGSLMRAEIEGLIEVDHRWLEESVRQQRKPHIHFGKMFSKEVRDSMFVAVGYDGGTIAVETEDRSVGKITAGPAATGSFVTGSFDATKLDVGGVMGPMMASALNLASDKWDLGLPHLTAAPNLIS